MKKTRLISPLVVFLAVAASASAQTDYAASITRLDLGFQLRPASNPAGPVTYTDGGVAIYNDAYDPADPRSVGPFMETEGTGFVHNWQDPRPNWDPTLHNGFFDFSTDTRSVEGFGTSRSSFGMVQTVSVTNHGAQAIDMIFDPAVLMAPSLEVWGDLQDPLNFANVQVEFGMTDDHDPTVGGTVRYAADHTGVLLQTAAGWSYRGNSLWRPDNPYATIAPGQTHTLRFFGIIDAATSAYNPVPEPTSLAALGLGAVAFLRRRKRG